eukprot:scaffold107379_cov68-Phaeocystis_antarctica.AAC.6
MAVGLRLVVQLGLFCVACGMPAGVKGPAPTNCVSVSPSANDYWCQTTCATGRCPKQICQCDAADGASSALAADAKVGATEATEAAASEAKDASKSKHSEKWMAKHVSTKHSATWLAKHPPAKKMQAKPVSQPSVADDINGASEGEHVVIIGAEGEEAQGETDALDGAPPKDPVDPASCLAISSGATDSWCFDTCSSGPCPEEFCGCSRLITTPP